MVIPATSAPSIPRTVPLNWPLRSNITQLARSESERRTPSMSPTPSQPAYRSLTSTDCSGSSSPISSSSGRSEVAGVTGDRSIGRIGPSCSKGLPSPSCSPSPVGVRLSNGSCACVTLAVVAMDNDVKSKASKIRRSEFRVIADTCKMGQIDGIQTVHQRLHRRCSPSNRNSSSKCPGQSEFSIRVVLVGQSIPRGVTL